MSNYNYPRVGFGVMIQNERGEVLFGLRKGSHGEGEWSFPGGKLENGETLFESAKREVKEECDLDADNFIFISLADEMKYLKTDGKQFFNIGLKANTWSGNVELNEPDKFVDWKWFQLDDLPNKLLEGTELMLDNYKKGKIY
jgi:8-oxo-dGTP diphosphatase